MVGEVPKPDQHGGSFLRRRIVERAHPGGEGLIVSSGLPVRLGEPLHERELPVDLKPIGLQKVGDLPSVLNRLGTQQQQLDAAL